MFLMIFITLLAVQNLVVGKYFNVAENGHFCDGSFKNLNKIRVLW